MPIRRLVRSGLYGLITFLSCLSLLLAAHAIRTYRSLPIDSPEVIMNRRDTGLTLYDRNNQEFFTFDRSGYKKFVSLSSIPLHVQQAVIAAEDGNFYEHPGLSARGIIRSLYLNIHTHSVHYGGSTITQQLAKNAYFTSQKKFSRKFSEALLALKLERHFTKNEILEMYLNSAYFGHNVFGIEAAAQTYFGKNASNLTLTEGALLTALLPAPSALSAQMTTMPARELQERHAQVLRNMQRAGYLSTRERIAALLEPLSFNQEAEGLNKEAAHFALLVRDTLYQQFGREAVLRQGFHVTTTLDLAWQKEAERTLQQHLVRLAPQQATNGAVVVLDPTTGQIHALVGSVDWHREPFGKINMATHPRQTGSAIKPLVYAAALEDGSITPATILTDRPRTFGTNYRPANFDQRFRGPVSVRYALGNSLNVPAVEVAEKVGLPRIAAVAQAAGLDDFAHLDDTGLALALGAKEVSLLDLTSAYGTFANHGKHVIPQLYTAITTKEQQTVPLTTPSPTEAISSRVAWQITSILSDNQTRRPTFGNALQLPFPAAAKTGTSQEYRDAWAIGYTPTVVTGVWVGNSDNTPMKKLAGATGAVPIWQDIMKTVASAAPPLAFTPPPTVVAIKTCGHVEYYASDNYPHSPRCPRRPSPLPTPTP